MQPFNETEWLKLIYLLADTQQWVDDLCKQAFMQLPLEGKKTLFKQHFYLTPAAIVHITERHYHKLSRYPQCGKFHIPLTEIFHLIRQAAAAEPKPLPGNSNFYRTLTAPAIIGTDGNGQPAAIITVVTHPSGRILSAFPGLPALVHLSPPS